MVCIYRTKYVTLSNSQKNRVAFLLHMLSHQEFILKLLQQKYTMTPALFHTGKHSQGGGRVCYKDTKEFNAVVAVAWDPAI